jgi:hypothetical protein
MGLHRLLRVVLGLIATGLCLVTIPLPPAAAIEPDFGVGHELGSTRSQRDQDYADQPPFFYWQIGRSGYQEK